MQGRPKPGVGQFGDSLTSTLIPAAKAGIHSANLRKFAVDGLDSSRHGGTGMTGVSEGILGLWGRHMGLKIAEK
jgi:hypothetical protein